jgi:alpha-1,2-mannosyltransferase
MDWQLKNYTLIWLGTVLSIGLLLGLVIAAGFLLKGNSVVDSLWSTTPAQVVRVFQPNWHQDSWRHMLHAYRWKLENPERDMYAIFFQEAEVKFQYPPSSLLIFDLFPFWMTEPVTQYYNPGKPLLRWLDGFSTGAVLLTALISAAILEVGLCRLNPQLPVQLGWVTLRFVLAVALGLMSYPLVIAHWIGQIQVFLTCLAALGLLFYLLGWKIPSGACFGLCCLVKPQWGLILLWALLRRRWRFAGGLAGVVLLGLSVSLARFGLRDHLQYLQVLRFISRVGESYWANQSVNGLLNRLLENGDPYGTNFAPYHPIVYVSTLVSSLVMLALAFWPRGRNRRWANGAIDLSVILVAATIASPVVWHHHYGVFLPVMAVVLPALVRARPLGRLTLPLFGLSYIAIANVVVRPELIYQSYWLSIAGWHMFYGGLLFFALLLVLRAAAERQMILPARHFLELAFLDEPVSVQDGISGENTMVIFPHFWEKK